MPHEQVPYHRFAQFGPPQSCYDCPTAKAVVRAGNAALAELRAAYNTPPDHAETTDTACWVRRVDHAWNRHRDPRYAELLGRYQIALDLTTDMYQNCSGGTISRPPVGPAQHTCHYEPPAAVSELPVPPGVTPVTPGG